MPFKAKSIPVPLGPSPWAWRGHAWEINGSSYRCEDFDGPDDYSGIIRICNEGNEDILLVDFYVYANQIEGDRFLIWWEDRDNHSICFCNLELAKLKPIPNRISTAAQMKSEKQSIHGIQTPNAIKFDSYLESGKHSIDTPVGWDSFEETIVLADYAPGANHFDQMRRAIFAFDWSAGQVNVIPQDWFNNGSYDFGYQWITRVGRRESGELVGDGIRLSPFELDESGRNIKRNLKHNPFTSQ